MDAIIEINAIKIVLKYYELLVRKLESNFLVAIFAINI